MKAFKEMPSNPIFRFFWHQFQAYHYNFAQISPKQKQTIPTPKMYICKYIKMACFYIPSSVTHVTLFSLALFYLYYLILPPKKGPPWCTKRWGCPISSLSLKCVQDDCAHFLSRFEYFQVWKNLARVIWVKWNIFSFVPPASKKIAGGPKNTGED